MAEKTYKLDIITPTRVIFSGEVVSFSAPGVVGGFQVLFNHAPLLAEFGAGEIKLQESNGNLAYFATSGGYVDVVDNNVTVLAETIERLEEIDIPRAESARERALKKLSEKISETERNTIKVELDRALNRIRVAEKRR